VFLPKGCREAHRPWHIKLYGSAWYPYLLSFIRPRVRDGRGQNSRQVDNLTRLRSRSYSFKVYVFATFAGPFLTLSRALDATLLFLLLFFFAGTFSLAFIYAFCLRA
jgi:hypothetical protein